MARSNTEVVRVEILFPPAVANAVQAAAQRAGMRVSTWIAAQSAKAAGAKYTPPTRGRPRKPVEDSSDTK